MKILISALVFLSVALCKVSAQSIDIAATMATGDANFYKNVPCVSLSYSYDLKKQFIFIELNESHKNSNDYAEYSRYLNSEDSYYIQIKNGSFSAAGINLGIAQKIITSDCFNFSVGVKGGLNYYKLENDVNFLSFHTRHNGTISSETENEKRINKPGIGMLIDLELKQFIRNNLSLFSRLDVYHSDYVDKPIVLDDFVETHSRV